MVPKRPIHESDSSREIARAETRPIFNVKKKLNSKTLKSDSSLSKFLNNKKEKDPDLVLKKFYEGWSLFSVIDINFYQRMSLNILTLQNQEMRSLYL